MAYLAYICKLKNIRAHPNGDFIKIAEACNDTVIVELDASAEDLYVYFPPDGRLSQDFCDANNLIGYTDPKTGKKKGGFFGTNRKVRVQKFRGEKSYGFATEISSLGKMCQYLQKNNKINSLKSPFIADLEQAILNLKEGDSFTELAEVPICEKFVTKATREARNGKNKQKKNIRFPEHFDTKQFRYELNKIPDNSLIYLNVKVHGTSARYGHVQEEVPIPLPWWKRASNYLHLTKFKPETKFEWIYQAGTRRVELNPDKRDDYYGKEEYRFSFMKNVWHLLRKGEVIYLELCGYTDTNKLIMPAHNTDKLDKELRKKYGKQMIYKYDCPEGTCKPFVYRVTQVNEDGVQFDLPWPQVKHRAAQLGLETVIQLEGPLFVTTAENQKCAYTSDGLLINLQEMVENETEGSDPLDESHIREGVVVRIEHGSGVYFLKQKSFNFLLMESRQKDNNTILDTEEAEDNEA